LVCRAEKQKEAGVISRGGDERLLLLEKENSLSERFRLSVLAIGMTK